MNLIRLLARQIPLVLAAVLILPALPTSAADMSHLTPEAKKAVERATALLRKTVQASDGGTPRDVLSVYALVKAGEPKSTPEVKKVLAAIIKRCSGDKYSATEHHFYCAGLEMMLLGEVDPVGYRADMEKITKYIIEGQRDYGVWYYPNRPPAEGDTSISQYAMLGLWAAERAEIKVPKEVWDRAAQWHIRTQKDDGGFAYQPFSPKAEEAIVSKTMTEAGAVDLLLARMHLFPGAPFGEPEKDTTKPAKFGVLSEVKAEVVEFDQPAVAGIKSTPQQLEKAAQRAINLTAKGFTSGPDHKFPLYYFYGLERLTALANIKILGSADWHKEGTAWLVKHQTPSGSWSGDISGDIASCAFGVLFIMKATNKMLGRSEDGLGSGVLTGGRGLPDDLNAVNADGTSAKPKEEIGGPLDELLGRLENPGATDVPALQKAVLDAVRFGDREKLIGQRERLRKLSNHPDPEVRRTVYWALGRGGELADAGILVKGVADRDGPAAVEAHNALCVLSLRPNAFDLPPDPWSSLPETASDKDREKALDQWQVKAENAWNEWYLRVAPYDERDGLGIFDNRPEGQ